MNPCPFPTLTRQYAQDNIVDTLREMAERAKEILDGLRPESVFDLCVQSHRLNPSAESSADHEDFIILHGEKFGYAQGNAADQQFLQRFQVVLSSSSTSSVSSSSSAPGRSSAHFLPENNRRRALAVVLCTLLGAALCVGGWALFCGDTTLSDASIGPS